MVTISCINNKGGVGKTTTVVNLAHALANKDKRILVIDQDSQCNTTTALAPATSARKTLYNIYSGDAVNVKDCTI